jgi:hypothetical protein
VDEELLSKWMEQADQRMQRMERSLATLAERKPDKKPKPQSPFVKRKEAIELLGARCVLEACERAGWLKATTRQKRLVLYLRKDVMACVYRISKSEYPD